MRKMFVVLLLTLAVGAGAAAPKKKSAPPRPATNAPDEVPHSMALFLTSMSKNGNRTVTFKATAHATRFFFEEPGGVTVYRFQNGDYIKEEFLRGFTLQRAVNRYASKRK